MASYKADAESSTFQWERRMGVHLAYHQDPVNYMAHTLLIPLQLLGLVGVCSAFPLSGSVTLAHAVLLAIAPVYLLPEPLVGVAVMSFLLACCAMVSWAGLGPWLCLALFAIPFSIQTQVAHRLFEQVILLIFFSRCAIARF